jgi:hypothetical protein
MKNLKNKVKELEEAAEKKIKANPKWRLKYAKARVLIERMVEIAYCKKPLLEKEIIARELNNLKQWPNEQAYLDHIDRITPMLDELRAKINKKAVTADADRI